MRIAIFQNMKFGGAMRASHETAGALANRGHELHLFRYAFNRVPCDLYDVPDEAENPLDFSDYATIHDLPDPRPRHSPTPAVLGWRAGKVVRTMQLLRDLAPLECSAKRDAAAIDALKCDAVLLHLCRFTNAPLLLKHLRTRTYWFCQEPTRSLFEGADARGDAGLDYITRRYRRRRRDVEITAARSAGTVLCNSAFSREFIRRSYERDAVVCRLGVNATTFSVDAARIRKHQVICWGPLWPLKGLDFVIRSVAAIPERLRPVVVFPWTRGSESYRDSLERLARELGVALDMPRGLSDEGLLRRIHESKVCVYAARMEPLGLVPLEAMAAGVPVVGVREGGVQETVVDGVTGWLCSRNEAEFSNRLLSLLQDDEMRRRMGTSAAEYVRTDWTWDRSARELETLFLRTGERN